MDTTAIIKGRVNPFSEKIYAAPIQNNSTLKNAINEFLNTVEEQEGFEKGTAKRLLKYCQVFVNNISIDVSKWDEINIKPDDDIICNVLPLGAPEGAEKSPLRYALMAASVLAAVGLGVATSGWAYSGVLQAGAGALGMFISDRISPIRYKQLDSDADTKKDTAYQIKSGRNDFRLWQTIPILLGRHRVAPPFAAQPYVTNSGRDQFWHALFIWGYAESAIVPFNTLKIGDTLLSKLGGSILQQTYILQPNEKTKIYEGSVVEQSVNIELEVGADYIVRTIAFGGVDPTADMQLSIDLALPLGLYQYDNINNKYYTTFVYFDVQYKLSSSSVWIDLLTAPISGTSGNIQRVWTDQDTLNMIVLDLTTQKIVSFVPTTTDQGPTNSLPLWQVWARANPSVPVYAIDIRSSNGFPLDQFILSTNQYTWTITGGSAPDILPGYRISDNFRSAIIRTISKNLPAGSYDVRIKRTTPDRGEEYTDTSYFYTLRARVNTPAIKFPYPVLVTEMRIQASEQLNGAIDNLTGIVTNQIPCWNGSSWLVQPWLTTYNPSNPAAVIRYILTSNANEKRVTTDMIDNDSLVEFWNHCRDNNFSYNKYIESAEDAMDLLGEVAAAGRAFVVQPNGKYAIVIDKVKPYPVQMFTPANSWGFESSRKFYELPDAYRIAFFDANNDWLTSERIVEDDGITNPQLFESIQIPGVTNPDIIWRLGREYFRTAKLRPETHTINVDMEYLIAGRRDWVKVAHDVIMVSLAYGRIKEVIEDSTGLITGVVVENTAYMESGKDYALTIRSSNDASIADDLRVINVVGEWFELTFVTPQPIDSINVGDMYSFGEYERTIEDYIISHIETSEGMNASVSLIPYSPEIYDTGVIPPYVPNVSQGVVPALLAPTPPTNVFFKETLELRGNMATNIVYIIWLPPNNSPVEVTSYQLGYRQVDGEWVVIGDAVVNTSVEIIGLPAGLYDIRIRSISRYSTVSEWFIVDSQYFHGDTQRPPDVTGLTTYYSSNRLQLGWQPVNDIRPIEYEIRYGATWLGGQVLRRQVETNLPVASDGIYFIKAVTRSGVYSLTPAIINVVGAAGLQPNVIAMYDDAPYWDGIKEGFDTIGNDLRLIGTLNGIYYADNEITLSAAVECNVAISYSATPFRNNDIYAIADIYTIADIYGSVDAGYEVRPQISIQDATDIWSDWRSFGAGKYIGKGFRFRLVGALLDPDIYFLVSHFTYSVDVPDRLISIKNVSIPATTGYTWVFDPPFNIAPTIVGSYVSDSGAPLSFTVNTVVTAESAVVYIRDTVGAAVDGLANLYAQGY